VEEKAQVQLVNESCRGSDFWTNTLKDLHYNQATGTELHPLAQTTQTHSLPQPALHS